MAFDEDGTPRVDTSEPWKDYLTATMGGMFGVFEDFLHIVDSWDVLGSHPLPCVIDGLA